MLPPGRVYRVQPYAFGLPAGSPRSIAVGTTELDAGRSHVRARGPPHGNRRFSGRARRGDVSPSSCSFRSTRRRPGARVPSLYGDFPGCDPMLGPPHGGSPACNRALTSDGRFDLLVPAGRYYVYATRGPFASLDRRDVTLGAG